MKKTILILGMISLFSIISHAQDSIIKNPDKKSKDIIVNLKDSSMVTVYIDGMVSSAAIIDLLDFDKIESIKVVKGSNAIEKSGTPNLVFITSKKHKSNEEAKISVKMKTLDEIEDVNPVVVIDDKISTIKKMKELSPNRIEIIKIRKDQKILEEYKTDVGVIFITTKQKN